MTRYTIQIIDQNNNILIKSSAILLKQNSSPEIKMVVDSFTKRAANEFLQRLGMGRFDQTIRLGLLSDGARECIIKEKKINPEKFSKFKIIE